MCVCFCNLTLTQFAADVECTTISLQRARYLPMNVLDMTQNNPMVMFQ